MKFGICFNQVRGFLLIIWLWMRRCSNSSHKSKRRYYDFTNGRSRPHRLVIFKAIPKLSERHFYVHSSGGPQVAVLCHTMVIGPTALHFPQVMNGTGSPQRKVTV